MWAAAGAVQQLLGLCGGAAFPERLLTVEPPVPGLLSLASTGRGGSCRVPGFQAFVAVLGGGPETGSGDIGAREE